MHTSLLLNLQSYSTAVTHLTLLRPARRVAKGTKSKKSLFDNNTSNRVLLSTVSFSGQQVIDEKYSCEKKQKMNLSLAGLMLDIHFALYPDRQFVHHSRTNEATPMLKPYSVSCVYSSMVSLVW